MNTNLFSFKLWFIILLFKPLGLLAQCDILSKDYADQTGFTTLGSAVTISSGKVIFDQMPGQSDHRVYYTLSESLTNTWSAQFEFNPQSGNNVGVAVSLFCLTAGNQKPYKDPPYTPATPMTNQDFIEVNLFSPHDTPNYINETKIYAACKDNSNVPLSSPPLSIPEWNKTYYAQIERVSSTQGFFSVFSDAARTVHILGSPVCFTIPETITGLNTLQHANVSQADADRRFTGWVDNSCINSSTFSSNPYNADFSILEKYCYGTTLTTTTNAPNVNNQWNFYECDANCNSIGPILASFTTTGISVPLNLSLFQQGHYYMIKHGTWSDCQPWQEAKKCFQVMNLPIADAGPDITLCASNNGIQKIGSLGKKFSIYSWSPANWLNSTSVQQPKPTLPTYILPCVSQTYTLTVTSTINNCSASDAVKVTLINQAPSLTVESTPCIWCISPTLSASVIGSCNNSLIWSPGGSTANTINASSNGTYIATTTNQCFSASASININIPNMSGLLPGLSITNAMTSAYPWAAFEIGKPIGYNPAYNATTYDLKVMNSWGNVIHEQSNSVSCAGGFSNGEISWNGICSTTGNFPSLDTYVYVLTLSNCNSSKIYEGTINFVWRLASDNSAFYDTTERKDEFNIYPNPASVHTTVFIKDFQTSDSQILEIMSSAGSLVYSENVGSRNEMKLDLTNIPGGVYLLRIRNMISGSWSVRKLIVLDN
jgi:hypothetical protein